MWACLQTSATRGQCASSSRTHARDSELLAGALLALLRVSLQAQQQTEIDSDPAAVVRSLQEHSAELARNWLQSADPRTQAWGAFLVLRDRQMQLIPDLLKILSTYRPTSGPDAAAEKDRDDALSEVLDALIQLNADVPGPESAKIYSWFPNQSLILLARSRQNTTSTLLKIFQTERELFRWLAAGNLLLTRRAAGFAAAVLEGLIVQATVLVHDPNQGGGRGGGPLSCWYFEVPPSRAGWPEIGTYLISRASEAPASVLAEGTYPVYFDREVNTGAVFKLINRAAGCHLDQNLVRQQYLDPLLATFSEKAILRAHLDYSTEWQGKESYTKDVLNFVQEEQQTFSRVVRELASKGLLLPGEAKIAHLNLDIRIWDARTAKEPALPKVPVFDPNITITEDPF